MLFLKGQGDLEDQEPDIHPLPGIISIITVLL
jgi:hypothetical protein